MRFEVTITDRGTLTIPAALRRVMGIKGHDRLVIEQSPDGLLLRPAVLVPVEMYTDERVAEFEADNDAIEAGLDDLESA